GRSSPGQAPLANGSLGQPPVRHQRPGLNVVHIQLVKLLQALYQRIDAVDHLRELRFWWVEALHVQLWSYLFTGKVGHPPSSYARLAEHTSCVVANQMPSWCTWGSSRIETVQDLVG